MKKVKELLVVVWIMLPLVLMSSCNKERPTLELAYEKESDIEETFEQFKICVYIVGEIKNPGVYEFTKEVRVNDVVNAAGGFTDNAATKNINLAKKVSDGEKIIVYSMEEAVDGLTDSASSTLVNINTADENKLMTLPGIGQSKAKDIINYREKNGPFNTIEDIMKVTGIKEAAFSKIEDYITVD